MDQEKDMILFGEGWYNLEHDAARGENFVWKGGRSSLILDSPEIKWLEFNIRSNPNCSKTVKFHLYDGDENSLSSETHTLKDGDNGVKIAIPAGSKKCVVENDIFVPALVNRESSDLRELGLVFFGSIRVVTPTTAIEIPLQNIRRLGKTVERFKLKPGLVSVVFPIFGDVHIHIDRLLISIASAQSQKGTPVEVVVSEQGAFPKLRDKLDKSVVYVFKKHVPPEGLSDFSRGEVRNDGVENSSGEFVYTNDADMLFLDEYFLAKGKELLETDPDLILHRPPMRRLTMENFEEFRKRVERNGVVKAIASLDLNQEFLATTDGKKREMKVTIGKDVDGGTFRIFTAPLEEFVKYASDPAFKGRLVEIMSADTHYGGIFLRREQFENVGGYCEQFVNWGCEDTDLQWKLNNTFNLQFFPKIRAFTVVHLDHERNYISPELRRANDKVFSIRRMKGIYPAKEEDKNHKKTRLASEKKGGEAVNVSAAILKKPVEKGGRIIKGAVIISDCDTVAKAIPDLEKYFYIVERRAWWGLNNSKLANIKLVEDLSLWEKTRKFFPETICLDIGPADFVDTDSFRPLGLKKDYDGIQVARWDDFKRSDLFVKAAALLPHRKFLKLGHFAGDGSPKELALRDRDIRLARKLGANIDFPYESATTNDELPNEKEVVNRYLNSAKIGILTTIAEGINRFKMECLAADLPVLVPSDVSYPTKKHINEETGAFFDPTPESLAKKIEEVIGNIGEYKPRAYLERTTGKKIALEKLKDALKEVCARDKQPYTFDDIDWDGRNQSLKWGEKAIAEIKKVIGEIEVA